MLVKDIMTKNPIYVHKNDKVEKLLKILSEKRITGCPVIDNKKSVVGILSDSDIIKLIDVHSKIHQHKKEIFNVIISMLKEKNYDFLKRELKKIRNIKIKDFMSKKVVTIQHNNEVYTAARLMNSNDIHKLPVVKNGKLIGIVTKWDIIKMLQEMK